jgi:hypothetical protein
LPPDRATGRPQTEHRGNVGTTPLLVSDHRTCPLHHRFSVVAPCVAITFLLLHTV